jgi:hypothetical protein
MAASRSEDANLGGNNISIIPAWDKGIKISAFRLEFRRLNQLHCFTGWLFQPSEKILVNGKDYPIYYDGKIKNVPNHQPVHNNHHELVLLTNIFPNHHKKCSKPPISALF